MANVDNPHGLGALRRMGGGPLETRVFVKLASFGTGIFRRDVVHQVAGDATEGAIIEAWSSATPGTTAPSGVALNHGAASARTEHQVYVDTDIICEAQDNDDTDGVTAANLGLNANIEAGAGNATTKLSGHEIDESTVNTSGSRDVKLLALWQGFNVEGNRNAFGEHAIIEIAFNRHRMGLTFAGV